MKTEFLFNQNRNFVSRGFICLFAWIYLWIYLFTFSKSKKILKKKAALQNILSGYIFFVTLLGTYKTENANHKALGKDFYGLYRVSLITPKSEIIRN